MVMFVQVRQARVSQSQDWLFVKGTQLVMESFANLSSAIIKG